MAAEAALVGIDPMLVLRETHPTNVLVLSAVIRRARNIDRANWKNRAVLIGNAIAKSLSGGKKK